MLFWTFDGALPFFTFSETSDGQSGSARFFACFRSFFYSRFLPQSGRPPPESTQSQRGSSPFESLERRSVFTPYKPFSIVMCECPIVLDVRSVLFRHQLGFGHREGVLGFAGEFAVDPHVHDVAV